MKSLITALIAILLLTGCETARSSAGLSLIAYSNEVQSKAADEIESGYCQVLGGTMMPDYLVLRDQVRVK